MIATLRGIYQWRFYLITLVLSIKEMIPSGAIVSVRANISMSGNAAMLLVLGCSVLSYVYVTLKKMLTKNNIECNSRY